MQALAAAETAYAHAMTATSSIPLPGECDGDIMKAALNSFSALPQACCQAHIAQLSAAKKCALFFSLLGVCILNTELLQPVLHAFL